MAERSRGALSPQVALWILAVLAALFFLRAARTLIIPIAVGVLISYALEPAVAWLERRGVHRLAGACLAMLLVLGLLAGGGYLLRQDVTQVAQAVPQAVERARGTLQTALRTAGGSGSDAGAGGSQGDAATARGGSDDGSAARGGTGAATSGGGGGEGAVGTSGGGLAGGETGSLIQQAISATFAFAGHLVVVFFLILFLLISGHHIRNRIVEISGDGEQRRLTATIIDDINAQVQRYLLVLLFTGVIVGLATWGVLTWMGVQHAAMWGLLAGVFNSIPYFGPVIVSGGLFVVGMAQGGGVVEALQMAGAAIVITSLEGWLIAPPLMGKVERMSALTVFFGLLLWTWLWGPWGTVLAVPMLVIIKSVADHVDRFRPVGRLMAP